MTLILALETSSASYGVAVGTPEELLADVTVRREGGSFEGIGPLVSGVLDAAGRTVAELTHLAVDIGPGNLSSVRTGIAYANGLAFSLGRRLFCATSLELLAHAATRPAGAPVLCLRNAGGGDVYAGLFAGGAAPVLRHGPRAEVVPALCRDLPEVYVAGAFRAELPPLLPSASVKDTGLEVPEVRTLHALLAARPDWQSQLVTVASPVTETSDVFGPPGPAGA